MEDQTRHQQIRTILEKAYDLDGVERDRFVAEECAGDPELQGEIESYLRDTTAGVEIPRLDGIGWVSSLIQSHQDGRLRNYRLERILGVGAYGVVYFAEQQDPVRRPVALKVLKPGMDTIEFVARFEEERQALASMNHPAIAVIYDGGATDAGLPFFAMEYVDGVPITEYVRQNDLDLGAALELFVEVLRGMQHAHDRGIVHRDLKPSHVLITKSGGRPVPKVIDFGIAKATGVDASPRSFQTVEGRAMGTVEYMSPEQAAGAKGVDARSDVYSLGVILFELLTGSLPYEWGRVERSDWGAVRKTLARTAATLRQAPLQLTGTFQGRRTERSLDHVLSTAMQATPADRWHSPAAFADALEAVLSGTAVGGARSVGIRAVGILALMAVVVVLAWGGFEVFSGAGREPGATSNGNNVDVDGERSATKSEQTHVRPSAKKTEPPRQPRLRRTALPSPTRACDFVVDTKRDVGIVMTASGRNLEVWECDLKTHEWRLREPEDDLRPSLPSDFRTAFDAARAVTVLSGGPETWEWNGMAWTKHTAEGPGARREHAMCYHPGLKAVVVFAGTRIVDKKHENLADLWAWNGVKWKLLEAGGRVPPPRSQAVLAYDPVRELLVTCAGWRRSNEPLPETYFWKSGVWSLGPKIKVAGFHDLAVDESRGVAVVFGNYQAWDCHKTFELAMHGDGAWREASNSPPGGLPREMPQLAYDPKRKRVLSFGGVVRYEHGRLEARADISAWDGSDWQVLTPSLPGMTQEPQFAVLPDSGALLLRDIHGTGPTWVLRKSRWLPFVLGDEALPSGCFEAGFVGLAGDRALAFGGSWGKVVGTTHVWRAGGWTKLEVANGPVARAGHAMTSVAVGGRRVAFLFGGRARSDATELLDDVWLFDEKWVRTPRPEGHAWPTPRSGAAAAYDERRNVVVLYGGIAKKNRHLQETWEWDLATRRWRALGFVRAPMTAAGNSMIFDPRANYVLLLGPTGAFSFDGEAWMERSELPGLKPTRPALAFDRAANCVRVFCAAQHGAAAVAEWTY